VKRAILLVDHGSRRHEANMLLESVAEALAARVPDCVVRAAHMDLAQPDIAAGIDACAAAAVDEIVVCPYFLGPGNHTREDIPRLVADAAARHPKLAVRIADPLGLHPGLVDVLLDRIAAAVD
jgi:sirohydrochlorin ferrochelatase